MNCANCPQRTCCDCDPKNCPRSPGGCLVGGCLFPILLALGAFLLVLLIGSFL